MPFLIPLQILLLVMWLTLIPTAPAWLIFLPSLVALFFVAMVFVVGAAVVVKTRR